jgi:hypothetical protein
MKLALFVLFICLINYGQAQKMKITLKKDVVSINQKPVFKLVTTLFPRTVTMYNLQDHKLAVLETKVLIDFDEISKANPRGRVPYFEVTFNDSAGSQCQIDPYPIKKHIAMIIIYEKLVKDGNLDPEYVAKFCEAYRNSYTRPGKQRRGTPNKINH